MLANEYTIEEAFLKFGFDEIVSLKEIDEAYDKFMEDATDEEMDELDEAFKVIKEYYDNVPEETNESLSKTKIYINGELFGTCSNPIEFTQEMREKRRNGQVSNEMNITYYKDNGEIYIFNDPGRARRPLIIVKDGVPLLTEDHLNKVANGKLKWDDL